MIHAVASPTSGTSTVHGNNFLPFVQAYETGYLINAVVLVLMMTLGAGANLVKAIALVSTVLLLFKLVSVALRGGQSTSSDGESRAS